MYVISKCECWCSSAILLKGTENTVFKRYITMFRISANKFYVERDLHSGSVTPHSGTVA